MTNGRATDVVLVGRDDDGLAPTIHLSTTFETPTSADARRLASTPRASRFYSRYSNPTVEAFESAVAALEGTEAARAYASGMGAICGVLMAVCSTGDHVVTQRQLYAGTQILFAALEARFGIEFSYVDGTEPDEWDAAIRPGRTMACVAETPANPRLGIVDLERFGAIAGPLTIVDSTLATPLLQQPARCGVDLVVHSATKGIAGHNDCTIGVVAGSGELIDWIWGFSVLHGATASPHDAAAALRGIRTLDVRMERQCSSACRLAEWLESRPEVASVSYPGLASHPQHQRAAAQMSAFGSLLTFDVAGGVDVGVRFSESLTIARLATSLGGPETLVTHPASTTHAGLTPDEMAAAGIGDGTLRVSVGLEGVEDLIADMEAAFDAVSRAEPGG